MRHSPPSGRRTVLVLASVMWACAGEAPAPAESGGAADTAAAPTAVATGTPSISAAPPASRLLDGLYAPGGPTPLLTPCGTGRVLVVEGPEAAAELERRVRLERPGAEGPVRVTVRGGVGEAAFHLDEVVAVHGAEDCPDAPADRALEGTAWQLSGLPEADPTVRAAGLWLRLDGETGRLEGATGCGALLGRYDWTVTRLRFAGLDARASACPEAALHRPFLDALARTGSYRVDGDVLRLLGEEGVVATFRSPER